MSRKSPDRASNRPRMGAKDYFPDHAEERRAELAKSTPAQRLAEAVRLSRIATRLAAAPHRR